MCYVLFLSSCAVGCVLCSRMCQLARIQRFWMNSRKGESQSGECVVTCQMLLQVFLFLYTTFSLESVLLGKSLGDAMDFGTLTQHIFPPCGHTLSCSLLNAFGTRACYWISYPYRIVRTFRYMYCTVGTFSFFFSNTLLLETGLLTSRNLGDTCRSGFGPTPQGRILTYKGSLGVLSGQVRMCHLLVWQPCLMSSTCPELYQSVSISVTFWYTSNWVDLFSPLLIILNLFLESVQYVWLSNSS